MFGYIMADERSLSKDGLAEYSSYYCGVCRALSEKGFFYKFTLNYDIAFLALILDKVYGGCESSGGKCLIHPMKKKAFLHGRIIEYAADMNIYLAHLNFEDDWLDEKNAAAKLACRLTESQFELIRKKYPEKCSYTDLKMKELADAEKRVESNIDTVSDIFGCILGKIFDIYGNNTDLFDFGRTLGKFIYVLDACIDLKKDLKRGNYNPMSFSDRSSFDILLNILMEDCINALAKLGSIKNDEIIKNIVYSGIWTKYEIAKARNK